MDSALRSPDSDKLRLSGANVVKICCGARCGSEPAHRVIYDAIERAANNAGLRAMPTGCRAACTGGVTVVLPDGVTRKVSGTDAANSILDAFALSP